MSKKEIRDCLHCKHIKSIKRLFLWVCVGVIFQFAYTIWQLQKYFFSFHVFHLHKYFSIDRIVGMYLYNTMEKILAILCETFVQSVKICMCQQSKSSNLHSAILKLFVNKHSHFTREIIKLWFIHLCEKQKHSMMCMIAKFCQIHCQT